jgi:hypothetical protein
VRNTTLTRPEIHLIEHRYSPYNQENMVFFAAIMNYISIRVPSNFELPRV